MECPRCHEQVESKLWFCPVCDAPLHLDDDILDVSEDEVADYRVEEPPEPEPEEIRRRNRKAWIIRIGITILIISVLVLALILLANVRKSRGETIGAGPRVSGQDLNIWRGASGMSSGERSSPVSMTSQSPSSFRR